MYYKHAILLIPVIAGCLLSTFGQPVTTVLAWGDKPRSKQNYDKPGHYEMVANLDRNEIDPGDSINISIFFSGYGEIGLSKVYITVNRDIFVEDESYSTGGLSLDKKNHFFWGSIRDKISSFSTGVMPLGGITKGNPSLWGRPTNYVDLAKDTNDLSILPEFPIFGQPPYYFHFATKEGIEAGPYTITLVYTYFNGQEWVGEQQQLNIKAKNIIERNPGWTWAIGILAIFLAFIAIIPILTELGKSITKRVFNKNSTAVPIPTTPIPVQSSGPTHSKGKGKKPSP